MSCTHGKRVVGCSNCEAEIKAMMNSNDHGKVFISDSVFMGFSGEVNFKWQALNHLKSLGAPIIGTAGLSWAKDIKVQSWQDYDELGTFVKWSKPEADK